MIDDMRNVTVDKNAQGTEAWLESRFGVLSASNFDKLVTSVGKKSTQSVGLVNQLIAERLMKSAGIVVNEGFTMTDAMVRGQELEDEARQYFSFHQKSLVQTCGFITSIDMDWGCSPDALVMDNKTMRVCGLEIKCPLAKTHVSYMRGGKLPVKYVQQVQGSMAVTGLSEWYFMSYHPSLPAFIVLVKRDDEFIDKLTAEAIAVLNEVSDEVERFNGNG
jgi:hypothetical protein